VCRPHSHCPSNCIDLALILLITVISLSNLHLLSKKHLQQLFCYTFLLTQSLTTLMKCSSSVVNPFDVATLLLASFYRYVAANKEYLTKDIIFRCVNLVRSVLLCLKFSFKLANTFWSYEEKNGFFFHTQCIVQFSKYLTIKNIVTLTSRLNPSSQKIMTLILRFYIILYIIVESISFGTLGLRLEVLRPLGYIYILYLLNRPVYQLEGFNSFIV